MNRNLSKFAWSVWERAAKFAGRSYIAGPKLSDALSTCRKLSDSGFGTSISFWNVEADSPEQIAQAYTSALGALSDAKLDCYLSIKLPPLKFDNVLVGKILEQARIKNTLVHFDSLEPEAADKTYAVIGQAKHSYPNLGSTLPGRWERSIKDADTSIELGLHVRVVKGQWPDPDRPDLDPRQGYLKVIERLAGRARFVAVATHDPELAQASLKRLKQAGTPCSLELLYGLPVKPVLGVAQSVRAPVRIYVPFGYGWLPYSLTQARRNPRIFWWMLRDLITGGSALPCSKSVPAPAPLVHPAQGPTSTSNA